MDREQSELSGLINIGSCGLHVLHGAFKTGVEAAGREIKKFLNEPFQPARRSDYLKITGGTSYPKMICVAETAIDVWDNVVKTVEFWGSPPKLKHPKCNSYRDVENAIKDNMILAKLHFFVTVANVLKPFLTCCCISCLI